MHLLFSQLCNVNQFNYFSLIFFFPSLCGYLCRTKQKLYTLIDCLLMSIFFLILSFSFFFVFYRCITHSRSVSKLKSPDAHGDHYYHNKQDCRDKRQAMHRRAVLLHALTWDKSNGKSLLKWVHSIFPSQKKIHH